MTLPSIVHRLNAVYLRHSKQEVASRSRTVQSNPQVKPTSCFLVPLSPRAPRDPFENALLVL